MFFVRDDKEFFPFMRINCFYSVVFLSTAGLRVSATKRLMS